MKGQEGGALPNVPCVKFPRSLKLCTTGRGLRSEGEEILFESAFNLKMKSVARKVLPAPVRRVLTAPSRCLDTWAVRRVRKAIWDKTQDALTVKWLSRQVRQFPIEAWIIQEVVAKTRPDVIIETGTFTGGSAYFMACLCDLLKQGEVISIDIGARETIPHPRITYLEGSSIDPAIVDSVKQRVRQTGGKTFVMLDSNHRAPHVRQELEAYAPLVPIGCYIHVQDGALDEFRMFRNMQPGPMVAAKSFLKDHPQFVRDLDMELRYVISEHPYGWLKRIGEDTA